MKIGLLLKFEDEFVTKLRKKLPDHEIIILNPKSESIKQEISLIDILIGANASNEIIESANNLKLFLVPWVGLDRINFSALKARNVIICNSKWNDRLVAEYALTLLLASIKHLIPVHNDFIKGSWKLRSIPSQLLTNSKILLIGYGSIGQELAKLLQPFSKNIIALRNNPDKTIDSERKSVTKVIGWGSYDDIIKDIDFIILSLPLTPQTEGILTKERIQKMKQGSILVNVGRGKTIDEQGLFDALFTKHLGGAAIDVWYDYKSSSDPEPFYPSKFPFHELENVIMSPHRAATFADISIDAVLEDLVFNIISFSSNKPLRNVINYDKRY